MNVYVGLDCGGSNSRVLAVDDGGNVLFQGQSGAANLTSTPEPRLRRNLERATDGCSQANYVCGCFAGLVSDENRSQGEDLLRKLFPGSSIRVEPDYTAAFYASPSDTDVCVIAGTGSLVCSRHESGMAKSGGRGYILGDEGSGFQYGRDAVLHFLNHPHLASPALKQGILEVFGTDREGKIITAIYSPGTAPKALAKMAKVIGTDAVAGELYAIESIKRNGGALANVVSGHVQRFLPDSESLSISLAGSIWKAAPFYQRFREMLADRLPERILTVHRITKPPLHGAIELAKELNLVN